MKKTITILSALALSMSLFVSCDDNNDSGNDSASVFSTEFNAKYPKATNVEWSTKDSYELASFDLDGLENTAWFSKTAAPNAAWKMTETDIAPISSSLPLSVKTAFEKTEYAKAPWTIDDIDMITRVGMMTVYVIDVENGALEMEIMYAEDGTHIKTQADDDNDNDNSSHLPTTLPAPVMDYIVANHPDAKIADIDNEGGMLEVDIVENGVEKELLFNPANMWHSTTTEGLGHGQVAAAAPKVMPTFMVVMKSQYPGFMPDMNEGIDYVETPTVNYYLFEIENKATGVEATIKIDSDGKQIQ